MSVFQELFLSNILRRSKVPGNERAMAKLYGVEVVRRVKDCRVGKCTATFDGVDHPASYLDLDTKRVLLTRRNDGQYVVMTLTVGVVDAVENAVIRTPVRPIQLEAAIFVSACMALCSRPFSLGDV